MSEIETLITIRTTLSGPIAEGLHQYLVDNYETSTSPDDVAQQLIMERLKKEGYLR